MVQGVLIPSFYKGMVGYGESPSQIAPINWTVRPRTVFVNGSYRKMKFSILRILFNIFSKIEVDQIPFFDSF